jgi:hypothetical protein
VDAGERTVETVRYVVRAVHGVVVDHDDGRRPDLFPEVVHRRPDGAGKAALLVDGRDDDLQLDRGPPEARGNPLGCVHGSSPPS